MLRFIAVFMLLFSFSAFASDRALIKTSNVNISYNASEALVIGESNYTGGWSDLPGVKSDVEAVSEALSLAGFHVEKHYDLSKYKFQQTLKNFLDKHMIGKNVRVVVYYAGHGHTIDQGLGKNGYIVLSDAKKPSENLEGFYSGSIPLSYFADLSKTYGDSSVLFIFDSCFSGSVFSSMRSIPEAIEKLLGKPTRQFITSGTENQLVPDISIFRSVLVGGLAGSADLNNDSVITGSEVGQFLQEKVSDLSGGTQTPMFGKLHGYDGEFVFRYKGEQKAVVTHSSDKEYLLSIIKKNPHSPEASEALAKLRKIDDSLKIEPPVKGRERQDRILTASSRKVDIESFAGLGYPFLLVAPVEFNSMAGKYRAAFRFVINDRKIFEKLYKSRAELIARINSAMAKSDIKKLKDIEQIKESARETAWQVMRTICSGCIISKPAIAGLMGLR